MFQALGGASDCGPSRRPRLDGTHVFWGQAQAVAAKPETSPGRRRSPR